RTAEPFVELVHDRRGGRQVLASHLRWIFDRELSQEFTRCVVDTDSAPNVCASQELSVRRVGEGADVLAVPQPRRPEAGAPPRRQRRLLAGSRDNEEQQRESGTGHDAGFYHGQRFIRASVAAASCVKRAAGAPAAQSATSARAATLSMRSSTSRARK